MIKKNWPEVFLDFSKGEGTDGGIIIKSMTTLYSKLFSLGMPDIVKGVVVAVLAVVLGALQQGLTAHGLDFGAYDWSGILDLAWKAGAAYIAKNFLSDEQGKFGGII